MSDALKLEIKPSISVALYIRKGNRILWVKTPDGTQRTFPRGRVWPFERLSEAGERVAADLGLTVRVESMLYTQEIIDRDAKEHDVVLYLGCDHVAGVLDATNDRMQWVSDLVLKNLRRGTLTDMTRVALTAIKGFVPCLDDQEKPANAEKSTTCGENGNAN